MYCENKPIMTEEEILEGNKLISVFMEVDFSIPYSYGPGRYCEFTEELLNYHGSWDWLMPVIDKIENIGEIDPDTGDNNYNFEICKRFVRVIYGWDKYVYNDDGTFKDYDSSFKDYRYVIWGNRLTAVWQAVVEFIKWYNEK